MKNYTFDLANCRSILTGLLVALEDMDNMFGKSYPEDIAKTAQRIKEQAKGIILFCSIVTSYDKNFSDELESEYLPKIEEYIKKGIK